MNLPDQLRDPQTTQTAGPALRLAVLAAADRIERLEAERDDALQDLHHYRKHLASVEAELERTRQAWVDGDDPLCEDVCMVACKGPCGGASDE